MYMHSVASFVCMSSIMEETLGIHPGIRFRDFHENNGGLKGVLTSIAS